MTRAEIITYKDTNIQLVADKSELHFFDSQSIQMSKQTTALQAWEIAMSKPMPIMKLAFRVRDAIAARFGVKKIGGFTGGWPQQIIVGDKLDFFLVEYISDDVLTLTERDKHLDVMTCISIGENQLTITSSVKTHNFFGRLYMIPVAPAHKLIVRSTMRRIKCELANRV